MPRDPAKYYTYWNFHKRKWAIRYGRFVIEHMQNCFIYEASFLVWKGGLARTRRDEKNYVHAFALSNSRPTRYHMLSKDAYYRIVYDPLLVDGFFAIKEEEYYRVSKARLLHMTSSGEMYCKEFTSV